MLWQVFGKVMVCRDLDTATRVARESNYLNCVTIKGDQVSKKGTMTGGYLDLSRWFLVSTNSPSYL
jgi:structural maintenance of chromosome 3 (chondroitin sulfate proteoglycan 6)